MKQRIIILHSHIFKNAGSTIDSILKSNFNNSASFIESSDGQFIPTEEIINTCLTNKDIVSISSHKIGLPPPLHPDLHFIPLVMLRNPLDRLGSIYSFYRTQRSPTPRHECMLAKRLHFRDFVRILIESENDSSFANLQTQFFLGNSMGLSEETWPKVVKNFQSAFCVGVVDKFDESLMLWSKYLSQYFTSLNFTYQKRNVSLNRASAMTARISDLEDALGEELLSTFCKRNQYDYQLYNLALDRVKREIHSFGECNTKTVTNFHINEIPLVENENKIDVCQIKSTQAIIVDTNPVTESPLYFLKNGAQITIPPAHRDKAVLKNGAIIVGCGLFDEKNQPILIVNQGQEVVFLMAVRSDQVIDKPIIGITVTNHLRETMFTTNSNFSQYKTKKIIENSTNFYCFQFIMPPLNQGSYSVSPAIAMGTQEEHTVIDVVNDAIFFFIPAMSHPRLPGVLYLQDVTLSS